MLLFHIEQQSLSVPLLVFVCYHVRCLSSIVLNHLVCPCLDEDVDQLLGAMLCSVVE